MKKNAILLGVFLLIVYWFLKGKEDPLIQGGREGGENTAASLSRGKENHPPRLTRVEIFPATPDLQSVLRVELKAEDADQDTLIYRYRWLVNQEEVSDQPVLSLARFQSGDLILVEVTPSDGKLEGPSSSSPTVKIGNHPPSVANIVLLPEQPRVGHEITALVEGADPEGDTIFYHYQWEINGQPVEGVDGSLLDKTLIHSADQIRVLVTPSDSLGTGMPKASRPVVVNNQPPNITSSPSSKIQNGKYTYQVVAQDPDGDPLRYRLAGGPPGMNVDASSGLLDWKVEPVPEDKSQVTIEVSDAKGGKSVQQFTVHTR